LASRDPSIRHWQQENEMLEKQRIFAKESIDRYFSSLEHHSSKHQSKEDFTDKPMEILRESLTDVQTLVNFLGSSNVTFL
jgi:response regulator of citrate/malate metabolism